MIENASILCFAPDAWNAIWRNRHQLMTLFAEHNRVLYVEPRTYLRDSLAQWRRGQCAGQGWTGERIESVRPNLYVYHNPPYAPISGRFPLREMTAAIRRGSIRQAMRRLEMQRPILWLCRPEMGDLIGQFDESLVVYQVVDEYSAYLGVADAAALRQREQALLRRADLVLTTAPALLESKRPYNPYTYLVPNAVDYAAFAQVVEADVPPPEDLAGLPRPLLGYVGAINAKLDAALLLATAEALRGGSLVLVGPLDTPADDPGWRRLHRLPNVHFLGQKPVEDVPRYIRGMDVCLLPYRQSEWTRHISSLKLYEYMACGKPVVSSDVPAARAFADLVRIADDAVSFARQAGEALMEEDPARVDRRRSLASQNTWRQRVERISVLIAEALRRRAEE